MNEQTPPSPLAAKALLRLKKLAEGNGNANDFMEFFSSEEDEYVLQGTITLTPLFESSESQIAGAPRGGKIRTVDTFAALKDEVARLKQNFEQRSDWIPEALTQLKEQPAGGWGLDDVRINLPNLSETVAASEDCQSCHGNKSLVCQQCNGIGHNTCTHCSGNRQEICHICLGTGDNPQMPNTPCLNCNGLRWAPCRFCRGNGTVICPTCHGKRGTVCSACKGAGMFTQQVTITCGARTHFKLDAGTAPSGLRRALDRLGMSNLAKGHADIEVLPPIEEEDESAGIAKPDIAGARDQTKKKTVKPEVHYEAKLPYADMRMSFAKKLVMVNVFGKKSVLLGVPAFLDHALEGVRAELIKAKKGEDNLETILKARVMRDALTLQLRGVANVNALRRVYPLGLSPDAAKEILTNMRGAINQLTLRSRSLAALICTALGACLFAAIFLTDFHSRLSSNWAMMKVFMVDLGILGTTIAGCWFAVSFFTRLVLQKRFPKFDIPVHQKTGGAGQLMFVALAVIFVLMMLIASEQPEWLHRLLSPKN